jgi:uncharacterized membrane protein
MRKISNHARRPALLYCGDDTLAQAARYLYGALRHLGWEVRYVPSRQRLTVRHLGPEYAAIILSDYPSRMIERAAWPALVGKISQGTGLLMIGGWGSFHGYDGNYQRTPLSKILPVRCLAGDDRVNAMQGAVIIPEKAAGRVPSLPSCKNSPLVFGYNKVKPKPGARILLSVRQLKIDLPRLSLQGEKQPLLVTGEYGLGRLVCFMSDLAPHWAGGLPDWGRSKVRFPNAQGQYMEVGADYLRFINGLIELSQRSR